MTLSAQQLNDYVRHESFRSSVYKDPLGYLTRGIGEHDGITENSPPVTYEEAVENLEKRVAIARVDARSAIGPATFDALNDVRQDALTDIAYNTGAGGIVSFYPMIQFIRQGDFASAAYHLLVNMAGAIQKYERQVGARGVEVALRIATGTILPEHLFKP